MGPLRVQKPFYPDDGACHVYLLHPPGGMAGHDELSVDVDVAAGAHALLTTPAANKMYRSGGPTTRLATRLNVSGALEWLPQGSILFGGSRVNQVTDIRLAPGARLIAWDLLALGRAASGDHYAAGDYTQRLSVSLADAPLLLDRQSFAAGSDVLQAPWGLAGRGAIGTLLATPADADLVALARAAATAGQVEVSLVRAGTEGQGLLIARALGDDVTRIQLALTPVWSALRPALLGCAAVPPRIWAT